MDPSDDEVRPGGDDGAPGDDPATATRRRSLRDSLRHTFGGRPAAVPPPPVDAEPEAAVEPPPAVVDVGSVQVMAHSLIADLFGAGLRIQSLAARSPDELQQDLEEVAEQIDKAIQELRSFAFQQRS